MSVRDFAGVLLLLTALGAGAEQRPPLTGVSVVRIANYGAPSVMVEREQLRSIVEELNQLRRKDWRRGNTRLSCYSTVVLLHGTKRLGEYRVRADHVVERPVQKGQFAYSLAIDRADLPRIGQLLAEIQAAKGCE